MLACCSGDCWTALCKASAPATHAMRRERTAASCITPPARPPTARGTRCHTYNTVKLVRESNTPAGRPLIWLSSKCLRWDGATPSAYHMHAVVTPRPRQQVIRVVPRLRHAQFHQARQGIECSGWEALQLVHVQASGQPTAAVPPVDRRAASTSARHAIAALPASTMAPHTATTHSSARLVSESNTLAGRVPSWFSCKRLYERTSGVGRHRIDTSWSPPNRRVRRHATQLRAASPKRSNTHSLVKLVSESNTPAGRLRSWLLCRYLHEPTPNPPTTCTKRMTLVVVSRCHQTHLATQHRARRAPNPAETRST